VAGTNQSGVNVQIVEVNVDAALIDQLRAGYAQLGAREPLAKLRAAGYDVSDRSVIERFNDGKVFTAAAGSFPPNGLGIYDLGGNVWSWLDSHKCRSSRQDD
jgi:hypothetical protein